MNSATNDLLHQSSSGDFWTDSHTSSGNHVPAQATLLWTRPACNGVHRWVGESLRGTNRDRRVETVRCADCGLRVRRIWNQLPRQREPDREVTLRPKEGE